jgi:hypothetical protein
MCYANAVYAAAAGWCVKGHRKPCKDVRSGCGLILSLEGRKMYPSTSLNDRKFPTLDAYRIRKTTIERTPLRCKTVYGSATLDGLNRAKAEEFSV